MRRFFSGGPHLIAERGVPFDGLSFCSLEEAFFPARLGFIRLAIRRDSFDAGFCMEVIVETAQWGSTGVSVEYVRLVQQRVIDRHL